jgi:proteic killer suppression protein
MPSDTLPGAGLHPLHGDRAGQWSISISGNWRVIFEFEGQHVTNVDLVDYH